ncbi:uncharacterized protein BHQ10_003262 [Talaromyces amestolkiae]|uniref:Uncharacterized protein n=1 Tax=Talaromyces amestolkiae TaxID=1196081 RepID=A0A364KUL7_TALAM|nr:uncharacterized protein BHQ10_003262 [Talaromyces amestolkiae]RAO67250.1 hypothetical protein BHQ10_003262 [Talaromyces amestolkiae]
MDNDPPNDERSKISRPKEPEYLPAKTFQGHALTRAKKLGSPIHSNESSSSASMTTPTIRALVVDVDGPTTSHHEDINDDEGDDEYEEDVSSSGSSTPKASRQSSFSASSYSLGNPPAYIIERPSTPRASLRRSEQSYSLSPTLPAVAYSPPAYECYGYGYANRQRRVNESMEKVRPAQSEQEVLDAMIDDLARGSQRNDQDGDDGPTERGLELNPARSLRRERR